MTDITEKVIKMRSTVFGSSGNGDVYMKPISFRLPLDTAAQVEAITDVSGKSRNAILIDLIEIGLTSFNNSLDNHELSEIGETYNQIKEGMLREAMER